MEVRVRMYFGRSSKELLCRKSEEKKVGLGFEQRKGAEQSRAEQRIMC